MHINAAMSMLFQKTYKHFSSNYRNICRHIKKLSAFIEWKRAKTKDFTHPWHTVYVYFYTTQ